MERGGGWGCIYLCGLTWYLQNTCSRPIHGNSTGHTLHLNTQIFTACAPSHTRSLHTATTGVRWDVRFTHANERIVLFSQMSRSVTNNQTMVWNREGRALHVKQACERYAPTNPPRFLSFPLNNIFKLVGAITWQHFFICSSKLINSEQSWGNRLRQNKSVDKSPAPDSTMQRIV